MSAQAPSNVKALAQAVADYARVKGISTAEALNKHASETAWNLRRSFGRLSPVAGEIMAEAKARGWKTRISPTAQRRAARILGTRKQILGTMTQRGVRTFRLNKRGQLVSGGKRGIRGEAAPIPVARSYAALETFMAGGGPGRRYRALNARAVAVTEELRKREVARGFLAISWLPDGVRKIARSAADAYLHQRRNKTGTLLGWIQSTTRPGLLRGSQTVALTSRATGVSKYPEARAAAVNASLANVAAYFAKKKRQALAEAIHRRLAGATMN